MNRVQFEEAITKCKKTQGEIDRATIIAYNHFCFIMVIGHHQKIGICRDMRYEI